MSFYFTKASLINLTENTLIITPNKAYKDSNILLKSTPLGQI
jgi:hypothetical protein